MYIKTLLCCWMWLTAKAVAEVTTALALEDVAEVTLAMQQHFRFGCIRLLTLQTEMADITLLAKMTKILSDNSAWVGTAEAQAYNYSLKAFRCPINRPLNVIFYNNNSKPQDLRKISNWAGPAWIMFVSSASPLDEVLSKIFLPLDAEFLIATTLNSTSMQFLEAYSVVPGSELLWGKFGYWSNEEGMEVTPSNVYERRYNLQGVSFDAVTTNNPPFTLVPGKGPLVSIQSFVGNVWNVLENSMNFSTNIYRSSVFMGRGGHCEDGRWATMVEVVSQQEVQFGVDVFTVTEERAQKVDFTIPLILERYRIFVRRPDNLEVEWRKYITPFSPATWIAIGVVLLLVAASLAAAQRIEQNSAAFTVTNCIFLVYGLFCQQGSWVLPQSFAGRISFYTACVLSVLLLASYSATLISFVTVHTSSLPFNNLEGLLRSGSYQFGVLDKTAEYDFFKNSEIPFVRELWDKTMVVDGANFPQSKLEGLQRVCDKRFAMYQQVDVLRYLRSKLTCDISKLHDESANVPFAFILGKGSPYRSFFNHKLLKMMEAGILNKFLHQAFPVWDSTSEDKFFSVNLMDVSPILVMLSVTATLSMLILFVEILVSKKFTVAKTALRSRNDTKRSEASRKFSKRNNFAKYRSSQLLFHFLEYFKMQPDTYAEDSRSWPRMRKM